MRRRSPGSVLFLRADREGAAYAGDGFGPGGCLTADPAYGITEDTGGHITYILGAMRALSRRDDVTSAEIVTRLFDEPHLGSIHAQSSEEVSPKLTITRIDSGNRAYLCKEELARDRAAFTRALIADLEARADLPDIIHAHFSDAADVARAIRKRFGIPFIYTAHSLAHDKAAAMGDRCAEMADRLAEEKPRHRRRERHRRIVSRRMRAAAGRLSLRRRNDPPHFPGSSSRQRPPTRSPRRGR